jgi:tetratricopeptide (TPR) repeat protein
VKTRLFQVKMHSENDSFSRYPNSFSVVLLALTMVIGACSTTTVKQEVTSEETDQVQPQAEARLVRVEPVRPKIPLTGDLLYKILEAEFAGQRGNIEKSLQNYLELAKETRDPEIVERATRIAVFARESEAAEETATLWVELDPRNPDPHQVLAVMALRSGDVESSLMHLESILDYTYGEVEQKLLMVANLLGREGDRNIILEVMNKLIDTRNNSAEALFAFSRVATILGEYDLALELLQKTYNLKPDDDGVALGYVSVLQRLGRSEDALDWLQGELDNRRENKFNLRMSYARLLSEERRYDEAKDQFEILSEAEPNNTDVMFALALLYLQSGQIDNAEAYFTRLSSRAHRSNDVNYYLGRIAEDREDYEKAGIWYQGVQAGPNYFDSQVRLGMMLAKQDRIEDARLHLNSIRSQNEMESVVLIQAEAELLVDQDRLEEAILIYDRALENGYNSDLLYSRAMLGERMGRLDILEADLRSIIKREPENSMAMNALGYTLADRTDRFEEAEQLIDQALELSPNDHYILDSKGWVLYRLGKLEEAILFLRRALDIIPDAEIAAHLGEVLWVKGDKDEARKIWETALEATPDNDSLHDVIQRFNP